MEEADIQQEGLGDQVYAEVKEIGCPAMVILVVVLNQWETAWH